jgi:beta-glucosidase
MFPFGFGLSYSTFAYRNLTVSPEASPLSGAPVTVSFEVTNTGTRAASDVAQVYIGDPHNSVPRPPRELKGFAKIPLAAGETKHVSIPLDVRAFSYYDVKTHEWKADPGTFSIRIGRSDADTQLEGKFNYQPAPK